MNQSLPMLTVSQLNEYVKSLVDASSFLNKVYVKGEISNFKNHYTGHFYFTLKDDNSRLNAVMFSFLRILYTFRYTFFGKLYTFLFNLL